MKTNKKRIEWKNTPKFFCVCVCLGKSVGLLRLYSESGIRWGIVFSSLATQPGSGCVLSLCLSHPFVFTYSLFRWKWLFRQQTFTIRFVALSPCIYTFFFLLLSGCWSAGAKFSWAKGQTPKFLRLCLSLSVPTLPPADRTKQQSWCCAADCQSSLVFCLFLSNNFTWVSCHCDSLILHTCHHHLLLCLRGRCWRLYQRRSSVLWPAFVAGTQSTEDVVWLQS